jgi:hypothetical protein
MSSKLIAFRSRQLADLESLDVKEIMEKANTLFELMDLTPDAAKYLEYHPKLAEAIEKW